MTTDKDGQDPAHCEAMVWEAGESCIRFGSVEATFPPWTMAFEDWFAATPAEKRAASQPA